MLQIADRRLLIAEPGQELLVSRKTSSGSYRRRDDSAQFRVFGDNRRHPFARNQGTLDNQFQPHSGLVEFFQNDSELVNKV